MNYPYYGTVHNPVPLEVYSTSQIGVNNFPGTVSVTNFYTTVDNVNPLPVTVTDRTGFTITNIPNVVNAVNPVHVSITDKENFTTELKTNGNLVSLTNSLPVYVTSGTGVIVSGLVYISNIPAVVDVSTPLTTYLKANGALVTAINPLPISVTNTSLAVTGPIQISNIPANNDLTTPIISQLKVNTDFVSVTNSLPVNVTAGLISVSGAVYIYNLPTTVNLTTPLISYLKVNNDLVSNTNSLPVYVIGGALSPVQISNFPLTVDLATPVVTYLKVNTALVSDTNPIPVSFTGGINIGSSVQVSNLPTTVNLATPLITQLKVESGVISLTNPLPILYTSIFDTYLWSNAAGVHNNNPLPVKLMLTADYIVDATHPLNVAGNLTTTPGNVRTADADVTALNRLAVNMGIYDRYFLYPYNPKLWQFLIDRHDTTWTLPVPEFPKMILMTPLYAECELVIGPFNNNLWSHEENTYYADKKNPVVYSSGAAVDNYYLMFDKPLANPYYGNTLYLPEITVEFETLNVSGHLSSGAYSGFYSNSTNAILKLTKAEGSTGLLYRLASDKLPPIIIETGLPPNYTIRCYKTWTRILNEFNPSYPGGFINKVRHFYESSLHSAYDGSNLSTTYPNWSHPIIGAFRLDIF